MTLVALIDHITKRPNKNYCYLLERRKPSSIKFHQCTAER